MRRVFVPRDAAAIACGAEAVVRRSGAARGRDRRRVVRNSSRGMFWLEPLVEVEEDGERWGFGPLDAAGATALVEALAAGTPAARDRRIRRRWGRSRRSPSSPGRPG